MSSRPLYLEDAVMVSYTMNQDRMNTLRDVVRQIERLQMDSKSGEYRFSLIGREYFLRKQQPIRGHAPVFTFAATDWKIIFQASPPYPNTETSAIWNVRFGGDGAIFGDDLVMLRVGL